jgi:hypothetical protein
MGAVTYPDPDVQAALEPFVALRLQMTVWQPAYAELLQRTPPSWNPTFIVTDHGGREVRRWSGFEPPGVFIAELELAHAAIDRLHGRAAEAAGRLERVAQGDGPASAEALYWLGAARYNATGDNREMLAPWDELMARFPGTIWALRADCLDPIRE